MADSDPTLRIPIVTVAEPAGAKQTAEAIKEVGDAAKEAAPEQDKLNESQEEGKEKADDLKDSKKQLLDQLRALRQEFPALAQAIDVVKNPYVAAATAIGVLVVALRQQEQVVRDLEDRMAPFDRITERLGKLSEIGQQLARDEEKWKRSFEVIAAGGSAAARGLNEMNSALERRQRFEDEMADSAMALGLAEVDEAEAGGRMGRMDAIRARARIRQGAEAGRVQRETAGRAAGIAARDSAISGLGSEEAAMQGQLPQALAELEEARKREARDKAFAAATAAEAEKAKADLQKQLRDAQNELTTDKPSGDMIADNMRRQRLNQRISEITGEIEQQTRIIDFAKVEADRATGGREAAEGRVGTLRGGIDDRARRRRELELERDDLRHEDEMQQGLGPARDRRRRAGDIRTGMEVDRAAADEAREMKRMFDEREQALQQIGAAIAASLRENSQKTIDALRQAQEALVVANARIDQLASHARYDR